MAFRLQFGDSQRINRKNLWGSPLPADRFADRSGAKNKFIFYIRIFSGRARAPDTQAGGAKLGPVLVPPAVGNSLPVAPQRLPN